METDPKPGTVADAPKDNWVDRFAPEAAKPYFRMARFDRPIGLWLLFWPCGFALGLAALATETSFNLWYLALFFVGAVVMRGAGCTFNDIVDRDIDDKVARTRSRPIPSGQVTVRQAAVWMVGLSLVGLLVLVQFNLTTILLGVASLVLVAIYPFMKRVTYWPQLFLGLAFSWGAFLGWSAITGGLGWAPLVLYLACILWTIGYDTIYALQDIEDDVLIGVKSTARLAEHWPRRFVAGFYAAASLLWLLAGLLVGGGWLFALLWLAPTALLAWQIATLDPKDSQNCLIRFRANHWVGLALTLALGVAGLI